MVPREREVRVVHPNPIYHTGTREDCLTFAGETGFGILAVSEPGGAPHMAHVPFALSGDVAEMHLMRSNPVARAARAGAAARLAVQGPHGYISPDWYGIPDQVPTWNYVSVHLTGRLEPRPQTELRGMLDRLSDRFEARLAPKPVWKMDKVAPDILERLMRIVLPFRFHVEAAEGTWKLAQHKPVGARLRAADDLEAAGMGSETAVLAALMRAAQPV
ncbi:negative transcriptional regulator [Pseudooceanicola batsensis HTCC2597]|uniref:Negative transcriptional regulator n=1 Tax=Pseudooceanicola batsensis (strain ATCC BAA-863 / DSM 15984 / KCTC 12145 / HTCC2597) TaxID=252305 RepID=A3U3Z4_PSEBH|nr:FMN-binding negative transcriptional regulator [Pseudooceanicola batsensis]EAQ01130.1 negative transcriptional regulator [Pseudooceanicola batsensis HTCC2597]